MGLCPYCNQELHLGDFFQITNEKALFVKHLVEFGVFLGEKIREKSIGELECKMFVCPRCQKILGFSEWHRALGT